MRSLLTTVKKLYPSVESFSRDGDTYKAYDKDGKEVTIDKSEIDAEHAKENYIDLRKYPAIGDQLDLLWHAIDADADLKVKFASFYNSIKAVKDANPKP